MSLQESVPMTLGIIALCAALVTGVAPTFERVMHRSHLSQAQRELRRLHRLSTRLVEGFEGPVCQLELNSEECEEAGIGSRVRGEDDERDT